MLISSKVLASTRILIVDENVSTTEIFLRKLRLNGYEVWAASSINEGLDLIKTHRPQAIILNLRMPLVSTLKFLRTIRAIPDFTAVPVAIVTGDYYLNEAQTNEICALGAEIRYKPLWLDEMITLACDLTKNTCRELVVVIYTIQLLQIVANI